MTTCYPAAVKNSRNIIPLFEILRTRHNLYSLCPHIDLTDDQFVGIRVTLYFLDMSHNNLFKIFVQPRISLYLCP